VGNKWCNSGKHPACFPLMSGSDFNSTMQCKRVLFSVKRENPLSQFQSL